MELPLTHENVDRAERYGRSVEPSPVGVATTNAAGEILAVNDSFAALLGYRTDELIGEHLRMPPPLQRSEQRYLTADGDELWTNVSATPIRGASGIVEQIVWMFEESGDDRRDSRPERDDEERRKLDAQREQAERLASLGRMAATIAHEFNNVLMGISPFVEVIRRGRSIETSLDHIGRAIKRGKRITEEILRFTRSVQLQVVPFEVEPWIENIAVEARSLVPPSCRVETFVQSSDFVIDGDASQLQQIFTNLILNARDAMPQGGTLSIEVLRERPNARLAFGAIEHPERFAHCIVRDTGCGMSEETLRQIYEPLFTTKRNGTGLGLPLAHQVVQRHGGSIFVESSVGAGTAFHIFLPLAESAMIPAASPIVNIIAGRPHHVLLVEDDPAVAAGLVTVLELKGLFVDVVESGAAAIRAIDQVHPDVVVLDVRLPDMEGTSVYDVIAAKVPTLPVIFSTGHADRGRLDDYLERPHVGYLLKPYESATLLRTIEDVLFASLKASAR